MRKLSKNARQLLVSIGDECKKVEDRETIDSYRLCMSRDDFFAACNELTNNSFLSNGKYDILCDPYSVVELRNPKLTDLGKDAYEKIKQTEICG
jgi:hypothetical protein